MKLWRTRMQHMDPLCTTGISCSTWNPQGAEEEILVFQGWGEMKIQEQNIQAVSSFYHYAERTISGKQDGR